jgi:cytochrome c556
MVRWVLLGSFTSLLVGIAGLTAGGDKPPQIKDIMTKLNKPTGVYFSMVRELREEDPMWDEVRDMAKVLAQQALALTKTHPPRGDKASWDILVKAYAENAGAVEKAVQKKDKAGAQAAMGRMGEEACKTCHKAHRKD